MPVARPGVAGILALGLLFGCHRDHSVTIVAALLPAEVPAYRRLLDGFEQQTGHRVRLVPQQFAEIRRALAAEHAGGRGTIDLAELDVYDLAATADHVAPLDEQVLASELADLDSASLDAGRIGGLRFLPHRVSWQALLYDHSVLAVAPATWAEVLQVARERPGQVALKGSLSESLTCDLLPFVWSAGGSGERFDDQGAAAAFRFFAELAPYLHPDSATFKEATIAEAMARGEIVMHLNWPFAMSLYASQGLAPQRLRSAPLPRSPTGDRATVLGGGYLAMARHAPHRDAAMRLLRYLVSADAQRQLQRELGWFSARRDVEIEVESDAGLLAGFAQMKTQVRPRPRRPDYPRLSRAWQRAFRSVAFSGQDPAAALAEAAAGWPPAGAAPDVPGAYP